MTALFRSMAFFVVVLWGLSVQVVRGQEEPIGYAQALHPAVNRTDLDLLVRELQLDEGQRLVAQTLLEDYQAAFTQGVRDVRAAMQSGQRESGVPIDEMREEQARIREEIRTILEEARFAAEQEPDEQARAQILAEAEKEVHALRNQLREVAVGDREHDEIATAMDGMREAVEAWRPEAERLYEGFLSDLQALLHEEQQARWPAAERSLRRSRSISQGELSGESVDLIALAERLPLDPEARAKVAPILEAYAVRLDEALKARERFMSERSADRAAAVRSRDAAVAERLYRQELGFRTTVRDVNDEYALMIAEALPETEREGWVQSVRVAADAQIYRPTQVERLFEAAADLKDLDEETRERLEELRDGHRSILSETNERLRTTMRSQEPERFLQLRLRPASGGDPRVDAGSAEGDPIAAAFEGRREMEQQFIEQLRVLLTPERFDRLPAARMPRDAAGMRGGGGGGGRDQLERQGWVMEQFDADGNGRLDDEERAALREHLRQRRGGGQEGERGRGGDGERGRGGGGVTR